MKSEFGRFITNHYAQEHHHLACVPQCTQCQLELEASKKTRVCFELHLISLRPHKCPIRFFHTFVETLPSHQHDDAEGCTSASTLTMMTEKKTDKKHTQKKTRKKQKHRNTLVVGEKGGFFAGLGVVLAEHAHII